MKSGNKDRRRKTKGKWIEMEWFTSLSLSMLSLIFSLLFIFYYNQYHTIIDLPTIVGIAGALLHVLFNNTKQKN